MDMVALLIKWLDQLIEESEGREPAPDPKCVYCGAFMMYDLFKGEYCPRCNRWS